MFQALTVFLNLIGVAALIEVFRIPVQLVPAWIGISLLVFGIGAIVVATELSAAEERKAEKDFPFRPLRWDASLPTVLSS